MQERADEQKRRSEKARGLRMRGENEGEVEGDHGRSSRPNRRG